MEKHIPFFGVGVSKLFEPRLLSPLLAFDFYLLDLSGNQLVSDITQCREVLKFLTKHRKNNPSLWWRQLCKLIFPIIHTHPLYRCITQQILTLIHKIFLLKCQRIMPPPSIRSPPLVFLWPLNLNYLLTTPLNLHFPLLKINHSQNKLHFGKLRLGCLDPGVVRELKLQAVDTVKLQPLLLLLAPVTPRPHHFRLLTIFRLLKVLGCHWEWWNGSVNYLSRSVRGGEMVG